MLPAVFQADLHTGICLDRLRKRKIYLTRYLVPISRFVSGIFFPPQHKIYFFPLDGRLRSKFQACLIKTLQDFLVLACRMNILFAGSVFIIPDSKGHWER